MSFQDHTTQPVTRVGKGKVKLEATGRHKNSSNSALSETTGERTTVNPLTQKLDDASRSHRKAQDPANSGPDNCLWR
jgi:hypothetical protein